jgi:plasmid stabilization system protein ParE
MKNGFKLLWTDTALADLNGILAYLVETWTHRELKNFVTRLERRLLIITENPNLFPRTSRRRGVRKSVLTKHVVIYYRVRDKQIELLTLFDPRQNPKKLRLPR